QAEHLRLKLEEGQPCPVCGAIEHPITQVTDRLQARVEADRERVSELERQLWENRSHQAGAAAGLLGAEALLPGLAERRQTWLAEFDKARVRWQTSRTTINDHCTKIGI